jgi:hypothetical protein
VDRFHQEHVPLANVLAVMRRLVDAGRDASFQITSSGGGGQDAHLTRTIDTIRDAFDDRVPILVGALEPVGRAATLGGDGAGAREKWPVGEPCVVAAWPVVRWDGVVVACANQFVLDGAEPPAHLTLGHIAADSWSAIRERAVATPEIRSVRTLGPGALGCAGCRDLHRDPDATARVHRWARQPAAPLVEAAVLDAQRRSGAVGFARRYGSARHASLVMLGWDEGDGPGRARGELLCDA